MFKKYHIENIIASAFLGLDGIMSENELYFINITKDNFGLVVEITTENVCNHKQETDKYRINVTYEENGKYMNGNRYD